MTTTRLAAEVGAAPRSTVWAEGDYHPLLERFGLWAVGAGLVERAGVTAGMTVLDVATGTGNLALPAAARGARVWGLDITSEMLASAEERARQAGLDIAWAHGDAEALPFADATFDRVLSTMGVMFATDHRRVADELVRVCRPGGVIGVCSWTPDSVPGVVGRAVAAYLPAEDSQDEVGPLHWGTEGHVRALFAPHGVTLAFERVGVAARLESAHAYLRLLGDHAGPVVANRRFLTKQGTWDTLCAELGALLEAGNETPGAGWTAQQEYLVALARKGGAPAG